MKKILGFLILVIALVAASGCTLPQSTAPVTTTIATETPPAIPTVIETTVEATPVVTTEPAVVETTPTLNETTPVATETTAEVTATKTAIVTAGMTPSTKVTVIHIANNSFTPSVLMVLPGTRITWVNSDNKVHSVKAVGASAGKFNSMDIAPTAQWGYDFSEKEGTFEYADGYNLDITGVVIVKKGESFVGMGTPAPYMTSNATW